MLCSIPIQLTPPPPPTSFLQHYYLLLHFYSPQTHTPLPFLHTLNHQTLNGLTWWSACSPSTPQTAEETGRQRSWGRCTSWWTPASRSCCCPQSTVWWAPPPPAAIGGPAWWLCWTAVKTGMWRGIDKVTLHVNRAALLVYTLEACSNNWWPQKGYYVYLITVGICCTNQCLHEGT